MEKFVIELVPLVVKELKAHKKSGNKASIKKLEKILQELSTTPYEGAGSPEALKHDLTGYWSRRINQKDRLIYKVYEEKVVLVLSAMGHYEK